jgi:hypothetical protein
MTARARLEATGTLAGAITDSLPAFVGVIYVPGTPFFALGDSLMQYELSGLHPGHAGETSPGGIPPSCGFVPGRTRPGDSRPMP